MDLLRTSAVLLGLSVALGPALARADPPPAKAASSAEHARAVKQAAALNDEAWALYEQGRYRAAVAKLEEAVRIDPGGKDLVYNLALIHEKLADFDDATTHYKRYLEMETEPKARARVQQSLRRVEGARRERAERGAPAAGPLAPESAPAPPPPAPPRPVRPWVVATGTIAATAFLLGGVFAVAAVARSPGSSPRTGGGISVQDLQEDARVAHADAMVADVSFLIAAAATGTATFLYFSTPRGGPAAATARLSMGPGGLGVSF